MQETKCMGANWLSRKGSRKELKLSREVGKACRVEGEMWAAVACCLARLGNGIYTSFKSIETVCTLCAKVSESGGKRDKSE